MSSFSLTASEEASPAHILIQGVLVSEIRGHTFLL